MLLILLPNSTTYTEQRLKLLCSEITQDEPSMHVPYSRRSTK